LKVLVYVEGPADRAGLEALLRPIVETARARRIGISFLVGGGKDWLLRHVGRKAADQLSENPTDWVFVLPDLYPMAHYNGSSDAHASFADLKNLLENRFLVRASRLHLPSGVRRRFRVHCLKHDLEVLLLAAVDSLRQRLGTDDSLAGRWRIPVEDQDDARPPKRVVEELFNRYQRRDYVRPVDAAWILERASLTNVRNACRQSFEPFVQDLIVATSQTPPSRSSPPLSRGRTRKK
jgi:Domain of unknown function (DUF4276)